MAKPKRVIVEVPATTANLGAGFDCLGLALDLTARFIYERADTLSIHGCDQAFRGPDNLAWTSFLAGLEALGEGLIPVSLTIDSPIPASGGLGSSSTCVVAGVIAAQLMCGREVDDQLTLDLATRIEGHPDNVVPATLGGLVSSFARSGHVWPTRFDVAPDLRFVAIAPPYRVLTSEARRVLPASVDRATCVWQMGRCVATTEALTTGNMELLSAACEDRLHEPYRALLIEDFEAVRTCALTAGASAFFISGSGATMMAVVRGDSAADAVAQAERLRFPDFWVRTCRALPEGTRVVEIA